MDEDPLSSNGDSALISIVCPTAPISNATSTRILCCTLSSRFERTAVTNPAAEISRR